MCVISSSVFSVAIANSSILVWRCSKVDDGQCAFFLWVDHEAGAKEWLNTSQLPPAPQTPTKTRVEHDGPDALPRLLETPFTKAKRKEATRDVTNYDSNDANDSRNANAYKSPLQPATA